MESNALLQGLISDAKPNEANIVLGLFDDASKTALFEHFWQQLQASRKSIDLDTLSVCIRLLPPGDHYVSKLAELVVESIPVESRQAARLYSLAELCLGNSTLGWHIFCGINDYLKRVDSAARLQRGEITRYASESAVCQQYPNTVPYLDFLKSSYWRPSDYSHYLTPDLVRILCNFAGVDGLDDATHDTLSALLSLLQKPVNIFYPQNDERPSWLSANPSSIDSKIHKSLIGEQLWNRYKELQFQEQQADYFNSSTKAFRTWFQWVSIAALNSLELQCIYEPLYWSRLRSGLLGGFSEQRKYCLGILRQSLRLPGRDIDTPLMTLVVAQRSEYEKQYEKYGSLFETIALDRYQNQIEACLPDLAELSGPQSLVAPGWITALLSAALGPKVQDGVRKLVGTWYIDVITKSLNDPSLSFIDADILSAKRQQFFEENINFLIEGFLPWATQGSLFTSSIVASRDRVNLAGRETSCSYGEVLSEVISQFVIFTSGPNRRNLLNRLLRFIIDRNGKIFKYSILYLLDGLIRGFSSDGLSICLEIEDFALFPIVSRLPGLPEIASDLCAIYCKTFCDRIYSASNLHDISKDIPGYDLLDSRTQAIRRRTDQPNTEVQVGGQPTSTLHEFLGRLQSSKHKCIQDNSFAPACDEVMNLLNQSDPDSYPLSDLCDVLDALWDEADRQEFRRPVAVKLPALLFHPPCLYLCIIEHENTGDGKRLASLLTNAVTMLRQLAEGKPYLLSIFMSSLREACFLCPQVISILPVEDLLCQFIEKPPVPPKDFLFEVAAAAKLGGSKKEITYASYYGKREWQAYAAVIDLLNCFPHGQLDVAKRILDRLLEPWRTQKKPIPIVSKWKNTFQLQAILILAESSITQANASWYLESLMHALALEPLPRYRYLLEWIISRIYYKHRELAERIIPDLAKMDDAVPMQIASLMKLAVLAAGFMKREDYTLQLMTQLVPFTASQKVQIRHEAHWSFPIVYKIAEQQGWSSIIENPAFKVLNDYIRKQPKFAEPVSTIRTLKLDPVADFTLMGIFRGEYLTIETPERELVMYDDFKELWRGDGGLSCTHIRTPIVPLGDRQPEEYDDEMEHSNEEPVDPLTSQEPTSVPSTSAPLQKKAGFDLESLLPVSGLPSANTMRPASVILVASLIDNPTNLGGLSRIAESFGLELLTMDSIKDTASREFQATAVTSQKHLPIEELKVADIPNYLVACKTKGYEIVGVEQTDRSGILGEGEQVGVESEGTGAKVVGKKGESGLLPRKCVLVLGSEKGGISSEVLAVVDRCVEIRTVGVTRSLNVQTAGGIAVYEWWREWGGGGE